MEKLSAPALSKQAPGRLVLATAPWMSSSAWIVRDGVRMRSGSFEKGEQTGQWTTYDKTGAVYKVITMKRKPK